jgi:hypothetical protein
LIDKSKKRTLLEERKEAAKRIAEKPQHIDYYFSF